MKKTTVRIYNIDGCTEKITNRNKSMSHGQVVSPTNRSEKLSKEAYLKIDQQHIFESELKQDMKRLKL